VLKKILLGAAVPVVALSGGALLGGVANAAPLTYADTSVAASHVSIDQVASITATFGTPATSVGSTAVQVPTADKVQFGATDSASKPLTWSIAPTTSGAVMTSAGLLSLPSVPVTAPVALTVEATDGTAKAFATVNVGVGASALTDSVSVAPDTVTIPAAADNNTNGTVDFGSGVPAGQNYTLGNAPAGVALNGSVLAATSAVPGGYTGVTVTATDGNATAVETFTIVVKGAVVQSPPPPPAPRPHLYGGHVVYVNNNRAEIAWNESAGVHCVLTRTFGYGFSVYGSPHIGFTCDTGHPGTDAGYWAGLAAGHGYDIQLIPAGANRQPLPGAVTGWIYIHTTS
jgi:hypothetical protein